MHSHGNPWPSEQQAPIRSMLYGSTHVQGLRGPSMVQHVGLCRMAEPDCIHCLGKGQHAPPLQHHRQSLTLRAARYNIWLLFKLTPKDMIPAPLFFPLFFSPPFLFFSSPLPFLCLSFSPLPSTQPLFPSFDRVKRLIGQTLVCLLATVQRVEGRDQSRSQHCPSHKACLQ